MSELLTSNITSLHQYCGDGACPCLTIPQGPSTDTLSARPAGPSCQRFAVSVSSCWSKYVYTLIFLFNSDPFLTVPMEPESNLKGDSQYTVSISGGVAILRLTGNQTSYLPLFLAINTVPIHDRPRMLTTTTAAAPPGGATGRRLRRQPGEGKRRGKQNWHERWGRSHGK